MKKIKFVGEFDGNVEKLPHKNHLNGATKYREPSSMNQMALIGGALSFCIIFFMLQLLDDINEDSFIVGVLLSFAALPIHEMIHAICFKEEVYIYSYLSKGMFFVVGTEDLSKGRYIFLSLLPNVILGAIPFVLFLIKPSVEVLGAFGTANIAAGAIDYINVFTTLTQVPKGAYVYMSGINTYWYLPLKEKN